MEKDEFTKKYSKLINECTDRLLSVLKSNEVQKIDFEKNESRGGELMPCVITDSAYGPEMCFVTSLSRSDKNTEYDQYKFKTDNGCTGYINIQRVSLGIRTEGILNIYECVADALNNGCYEICK